MTSLGAVYLPSTSATSLPLNLATVLAAADAPVGRAP